MAEWMWDHAMGWLPDYPDFRDYTEERDGVSPRLKGLGQRDSVKAMLRKIGVTASRGKDRPQDDLPKAADLREWCSGVEDQGSLGSCTAHAAAGLVEYFERRAFGRHVDASRLFLYKVTRNLLRWTGDTGAFLRTTMGAMVLFGVPPEEFWPYRIDDFDQEPTPFLYAFAQSYQAISYYRLDPPGTRRETLLARVKEHLAAGLPSMFGFTVYSSISRAAETGKIPFPTPGEKVIGGHAVAAVGYDDDMVIGHESGGAPEAHGTPDTRVSPPAHGAKNPRGDTVTESDPVTHGAILIRNSWGKGWGDGGYGWLPYEYVLGSLAVDWWSLLKNEWVDTNAFKM